MKILAVVPAYNEEECLAATISSLVTVCPDVDYLVVNDGSKDGTAQVIAENKLNGVNLPVNTQLPSAFRTGMKYALRHDYDAVVQFDADGQHLPEYIPVMAEAMEHTGSCMVIGSRFLDGSEKPAGLRGVGSRLITALIKLTTGVTITDPTSGMRLFDRSLIRQFATEFDCAPEPDMVAVIARKTHAVTEVQVKMQERQGGESYLNLTNAVKYMARTCFSILILRFLR